MAAMNTISAALKLVDVKKQRLRKAFEDLQAHSSSLSSFNLTWSDLDSYFTSLQSSLEHKFQLLQSQQQPQSQPSNSPPKKPQPQPSSSSIIVKDTSNSAPVPARLELKSFCEKMDGLGLRKYIVDRPRERPSIRVELPDALRCAPDAAAMVLDAMEGFYVPSSKGDKDMDLFAVRRSCVVLLEELMGVKVEIGAEVKHRARQLAKEWKGKVSADGESPLEALGFLHLLATYRLSDAFNTEDLIDFAVIVASYRQAISLCRVLGFGDRIPDVILKLIGKGKQLLAVKFIFEFELNDKFPPVPLLKEYVEESKKLAQKVREDGKNSLQSLNEATAKEVSASKSVIRIIEDHKLESEYPKEILMKRIEMLEKEKAGRKRSAATPASKTPQQSKLQKLSGSKHSQATAPAGPAAIPKSVAAASSNVPAFQQSHMQPAGLLSEYPAPYFSSPAGPAAIPKSVAAASATVPAFQQSHMHRAGLLPEYPAPYLRSPAELYGSAGSAPAVAPHAGSSAGLYGLAADPLGIPENLMRAQSHLYPSESHMPSGYSDRPIAYEGYSLPPQYHPPYYPQ